MSGAVAEDDNIWAESDAWFDAMAKVVPDEAQDEVVFEREVAPSSRRNKRVKYVDLTQEEMVIVYHT